MLTPIQSATLPDVQAEEIQCALHDRVLRSGAQNAHACRRVVLLTSGSGEFVTDKEPLELRAPCLAWIPWRPNQTLRIKAGAVGYHMTVGDEFLVDTIGNHSESANLRLLVDRRVVVSLDDEATTVEDARHAFSATVRELHRPNSGSWIMILAQVQTLLVHLWRHSGAEDIAAHSQGESSRILQRFRQLVEAYFRERWTVAAYAKAIGISHDRLHDICRRELGKPPKQLIQERVVHEARLRLERSILTVEQVASSLGFSDVSHFSRFFRAKVGVPPATFRKKIAISSDEEHVIPSSSYADWP